MDQVVIMGILQSRCDLLQILSDCCKWDKTAMRMTITYCTIGGIIHDEIGSILPTLDPKVENTDNVRMSQTCDCFCFLQKSCLIVLTKSGVQHFDCSLQAFDMNMLSKIDFCKTTFS